MSHDLSPPVFGNVKSQILLQICSPEKKKKHVQVHFGDQTPPQRFSGLNKKWAKHHQNDWVRSVGSSMNSLFI